MTVTRQKRAMRGFSLVEMVIVTSITLTISAVAIPKMMITLANIELRGAVHSAAGIMQQARMRAIKDARFRKVRFTNGTGGGIVYIDLNNNHVPDSDEPQVTTGTTVLASTAPSGSVTALDSTQLGYTPVITTQIDFSAIGQPCSSTTSCAVGMVMYFTDTRSLGSPGWSAVSVSPAGRIAVWMWNNGVWQQV
jgi:Tfp pilus assembly protein FimT